MSGIEVFRGSDIQAYAPPAKKPKAGEEPTTAAPQGTTTPAEGFAELGDLKQYDPDGNGKITKDEFNVTRGGELLRAKAEKDQELFKTLDANGDGKLSNDEFLRAFSQLTGDGSVAKVRDHIDGEFDQRKASDGTIHVDPKVQAGGGDTKTDKAKEGEKADKTDKKEAKDYTVKSGDTLNKIAKAHGVTLADLKEANPDLFKSGKDSLGKTRTAGGDLIYPGDKVKIPAKAEKKEGKGGEDKAKPLDDKEAVKYLQDNFDKIAGADGQVSRTDLAANLPEGPGKQALLGHFDSLMFASVDQGKESWSSLTKTDVAEIGKKLAAAGSIDKLAGDLTQQVIKDRGLKDTTGDGKVDAQDIAAYVKANGGDTQLDTTQANLLGSLTSRINALQAEKDKLAKDLQDPARNAEAYARTYLLNSQIASLMGMQQHVAAYRPDPRLGPEDAKKVQEVFGKIEALSKDLSNPTKMGEVQAQLSLAYNFLQTPKLYDSKAANGTTDPTLLNQAKAVQDLGDRVTKLLDEMNKTIPDLANPTRQAEAQARMQQLNAQVMTLIQLGNRVKEFRLPADLTTDQAQKASDLFKQIGTQAASLSDPKKTADAQAQITKLLDELAKLGK